MVIYRNFEVPCGAKELSREEAVFSGRLDRPAGMIVRNNKGASIVKAGKAKDIPWMEKAAVDSPTK